MRTVVGVLVVGLAAAGCGDRAEPPRESVGARDVPARTTVSTGHASSIIGDDPREVAGFATDVVSGVIVAELRVEQEEIPRTVYSIVVDEVLKGRAQAGDEIEVRTNGGLSSDNLEYRDEESPPLVPGRSYILLYRNADPRESYNLVVSGGGTVLLEEEGPKQAAQISKYRDIVANAIPSPLGDKVIERIRKEIAAESGPPE